MLIKKVKPVLPRPFIMAPKEVLVYINGQIKLSAIIKVPDIGLWNKKLPKNLPSKKNPTKHINPRRIQKERDYPRHRRRYSAPAAGLSGSLFVR